MSRKPINKMNDFDSREAIWRTIRQLKTFTVPQLHGETTLKIESVREYCQGLAAAGYIAKTDTPGKAITWQLVKDCGVDAPRVRKDGTPVTQGRKRLQMWRTMKVLGQFTVRDLAVHASLEDSVIKEDDAADYLKHLCSAGYLAKSKNGGYRFMPSYNTGPKAPMIQRVQQVWDPNLKKVVWTNDGGDNHD